jgi:alanine-glyoxylate transaminase / serine-glyoxylate transaminase / serine-pyruvate transaminase
VVAADADAFRQLAPERFDMSLGTGLGKMKGKIFRVGHLGHFNDLMLAGTLSGVEMGFALDGIPHKSGGVLAALELLTSESFATRHVNPSIAFELNPVPMQIIDRALSAVK